VLSNGIKGIKLSELVYEYIVKNNMFTAEKAGIEMNIPYLTH
jgi:hypothetical protein